MSGSVGGGGVGVPGTGGVDSSIPLQAGRNGGGGAQNPLLSDPLGTMGKLNQLQLFPLQQQQLQQQLELQRLGITGKGIENQRAGVGLSADQAALTQRLNDITANGMSSLALDPKATTATVQARLGQLQHSGVNVDGLTKGFAESGASTPAEINAYWRQQFLMTHPDLAVPKLTPRDVGGKIVYVDENPYTNQGLGGTALTKTLTPSEATTPTQIGVNPATGAPRMGTRQNFIDLTQSGAAGGAAAPSPTSDGDAASLSTGVPSTQAAGAAPPAPVGVETGLGPAQTAAKTEQGATSAKWFSNITEEGVQARSQGATLGNMLADAGQFVSGPTRVNEFKATLTKYAPTIAQRFGIDPKAVAANESFDKLAAQIQNAQGVGTDSRLSIAGIANPSSHLSQQGVDLIIRQLQGNTDYLQARSALAAKWPDQSNRAAFENDVAAKLDPRAFQFARMTNPQRAEYFKSLSKQDAPAVEKAYNWAHDNGLIPGG